MTIIVADKEETNQAFNLWTRQDALIYNALIGALETTNQPLIASTTTSLKAWHTLAST